MYVDVLDGFVFKDAATNEKDTHVNTLSLHDALPVYNVAGIDQLVAHNHRVVDLADGLLDRALDAGAKREDREAQLDELGRVADTRIRSEEHTSELQSLMRLSYAVFCLQKKIQHSRLLLQALLYLQRECEHNTI